MRPLREFDVYSQEMEMSCGLMTRSLQGPQHEREVTPPLCT